ncbi:MAG: four-carbon acid sugar kinase family protein [Chitinophagaceae bacterium]|nr:four-carbon acid sugar kinase family protein [Chitinophagaceae bacterium]
MIAVIADDFTGAAELAGISLRYGLKVELYTCDMVATDADVVIVSTDSRSLNKTAALQKTEQVVQQVLQLNPILIYKKIDSVLRGYVLDELKLQMKLMQKDQALILPANPSLNRTVSNGQYYVQGKPIRETGFAADPEFPAKSSFIKELLNDDSIAVLPHTATIPSTGIVLAEATSAGDVKTWAAKATNEMVLAGAGDFYTALLQQRYQQQPQKELQLQLPFLYMCGTAYDQSQKYIQQVQEESHIVNYVGKNELQEENAEFVDRCTNMLQQKQKAIIAFDAEQLPFDVSAIQLRTKMAALVTAIVNKASPAELFIEGGSTATAILEALQIQQLIPVNELTRGVVRMKAGDLFITVKPGSYELSKEIKQLFT